MHCLARPLRCWRWSHPRARRPPSSSAAAVVSPAPAPAQPVILFLVDNSASLPPLDPDEKRVAALEKMFTFLKGQPYRLVLFGGRHEISVDDPSRYNNHGQWTDLYFAFVKAREVVEGYPERHRVPGGPPDGRDPRSRPRGVEGHGRAAAASTCRITWRSAWSSW